MKPSPPSSRLPRWATGAGLLVLLPVAGWALGRRFAQARCSETATLLGSDPRLAKHAAQTREARGEAVFPLAWPARPPMHASPEPLYNAPNPTQRVAFVVAGGLRTFANANAHRSLFWHGLRALGGSVEAIFVVSTDHGWHSDGRDFLRRSHHADRAKIRDAIAAFDPVHVEVHSNADCSNETIARRIACCPAGNPDSRVPQTYPRLQAYWLAASLDVVRARERAVGRPYDWVVRVRPDLVLLEPLPVLANLAPTRLYVAAKTFTTSNIWDVLFLVPRALVADFGASFAAVRDACHSEALETQLRDEWRTRGVPYQAYPFAATLLRNEGHLDCGYFRHTALDLFGSSRGRAGGAAVDHEQWCGEISGRISGGAALFPPVNWTRTTKTKPS